MAIPKVDNEVIRKNILAGFISGLFITLVILSFANFIFVRDLKPFLHLGFGIILFSSIPILMIINYFSDIRGAVAYPFAIVCIFLATILSKMTSDINLTQEELWPTALFTISLTTLSLSFFSILASKLEMGNVVRYIPFPVLGGMLGAIGSLMILKSINSLSSEDIYYFPQLILALALALFFLLIQKRQVSLFLKWSIFILFIGISLFIAMNEQFSHWRIELDYEGLIWPPLRAEDSLSKINFSVLSRFIPELISLNLVFITSLLVNLNGIEAFLKKDVNLNRELKITSIANLVTACLGGIGGCITATQTIPNIKNGGTSFYATMTSVLVIIAVMILGSLGFFRYLPNFLLASVPIFLGMMFIYQWVYESKSKLTSLFEWFILVATLFTAVIFGLVYGVIVGVIGASALFIYEYSYSQPIREIVTGKSLRSLVDRSIEEESWLSNFYDRIVIIKLSGYLFFGNSFNLLNLLKKKIRKEALNSIEYLVVDFTFVSNLDSSALLVFSKIKEILNEKKIILCFCGVREDINSIIPVSSGIKCFPHVHDALEWIENKYLSESFQNESETYYINQHLDFLVPLFDKIDYKKSEIVIEQNSESNAIYIVLKGKIRAYKLNSDGTETTLRKMSKGALLGELSFFLRSKTFNNVVAEEDSELLKISRDRIKLLQKDDSEKLFKLYEIIFVIMSERILKLNQSFKKQL